MPIGHGRRRSRPSLLMERIGGLREELADATEVQAPEFRLCHPPEPSSSRVLELYDQNP